jgi:hypothetical protein
MVLAEFVEPPVIQAHWGTGALLAVLTVVLVAAVGYCLLVAVRDRDVVPLLVCGGGAIAVINEPLWDLAGQIVYAQNQKILYTSFGDRGIPVFLLAGYVGWVATLGLAYSRAMARGITPQRLYQLAAASFASVLLIELVGTGSNMWDYYGQRPAALLVVAPQMAPCPLICGFMIHHYRRFAHGPSLVGFVAIPGMALAGTFAMTSWPIYYVLNSHVPAFWNWVAAVSMLSICAGLVWVVGATFGAHDRTAGSGDIVGARPRREVQAV